MKRYSKEYKKEVQERVRRDMSGLGMLTINELGIGENIFEIKDKWKKEYEKILGKREVSELTSSEKREYNKYLDEYLLIEEKIKKINELILAEDESALQ